jgi:cobalt-zinc-cadmium efflux system outer membrane protein
MRFRRQVSRLRLAARGVALGIVAAIGAMAGAPVAAADALTLAEALRMARERAPRLLAAGLRVKEAEGRMRAAGAIRANPEVEALVEPFPDADLPAELDIALRQEFEAPGRRNARRASAEAEVAGAEASRLDERRHLCEEVAAAFFRALHARDRQALAELAHALDADLLRVAERRLELGEAVVLDVNLARSAAARSASHALAARAQHESTLAEIRRLLGMDARDPLELQGDLAIDGTLDGSRLPGSTAGRPDVAAVRAERDAAEADVTAAAALRRPEWGVGAAYQREEGNSQVLGGVRFTLPLANRGAGEAIEAAARRDRLALAAVEAERAADVELQGALAAYRLRREAVEVLAVNALPWLDDNQGLALRSYEAGQIGLPDYLLMRRELFETRVLYVDRLLEAALAGVEVASAQGAW